MHDPGRLNSMARLNLLQEMPLPFGLNIGWHMVLTYMKLAGTPRYLLFSMNAVSHTGGLLQLCAYLLFALTGSEVIVAMNSACSGCSRNYIIRCREAEHRVVQLGVCSHLQDIIVHTSWPASLRDVAAGCLCAIAEHWENQSSLVGCGPFLGCNGGGHAGNLAV
jgi:hypothetical protein